MRIPVPNHVLSLEPYAPGKPVEELERELGISSSIKLASNENPLGPSPLAIEAAQRALSCVHRYPDGGAYYLKSKLSERLGVPADSIVLGNGSTEIVELLAKAFIGPTNNAVVSEGAFIMYRLAVAAVGGACHLAPMTRDLRHDLDAMGARIDGETRLVYVANPNNPTGTYVSEAELDTFLEKVPENVIVVVDEAYKEYIVAPDYPSSQTHLAKGRALVILRTFSKIYGLAGLRIGYALTLPEIASTLERVRSPFNTSSVAQAAAHAALDDEPHVVRSRESNTEQLGVLSRGLEGLGLPFTPSVANFLLAHPRGDAGRLYDCLLREGVIVRPMGAFGFPSSLRISVGTTAENGRLLDRLHHCLERSGSGLA